MRPTLARVWIVAALALVLGVVDRGIVAKERIRRDGMVVYLELLPVDPRSLMQGDYMALRFALAEQIEHGWGPAWTGPPAARVREGGTGWAPIRLDARGVAALASESDATALRLRYRMRQGHVWLGTNAFFFEEGHALRHAKARFGEFRLDRDTGEAVLVALRDGELRPL